MITVKCSCGKTYQVKDSFANKKAKCTCGKVLSIPEISAEELDRPIERIGFSCSSCGKTFNVSAKFEGKKVRCKSCLTVQTIPMKSEQSDKINIDDLDAPHQDDSDTQDVDINPEKQVTDHEEDSDTQEGDISSEKQDTEKIKSSEKPKRLLIICLAMVLLGAIAYGLFIFYSEKRDEATPKTQTSPVETVSEKPPETTDSSVQEKTEGEVTDDETIEEEVSEETQSETKDEQTQAEPITPEPKKDELQSKPQKKTEKLIDKQPETSQKQEKEKIPDIKTIPDTSQTKTQPDNTQMNMDKQKIVAAVDPKTLKEDTKKYLRTTPMAYTKKQVLDMIQKYNFYEAHFNPNGGFPNRFVDNRNGTITDNETLLMWQKSGTREMVSWKKAPEYIDRLNNRKFSGYSDWRLPTLEELLTLTEPRHSRQGLYISSFFSQKQGIVGSSDSCTYDGKNLPWYISFLRGISNCISYNLIDEFHVRAVRSMDRPDKKIHN